MAGPISYAGVDLLIPSQELTEFSGSRFTVEDIIPFRLPAPRVDWATISWPTPWDYAFRTRQVRSNTLYWPTGASRWAMGFFWASEQDLALIREEVYGADGDEYIAKTLSLDDGENIVETDLWMLPPYPVAPQKVTYDQAGVAQDGLVSWLLPRDIPTDATLLRAWERAGQPAYIIPLVDDRYFWWQIAGNVVVIEGTTTWDYLYDTIATRLDIVLDAEDVAAAYLAPPQELTNNYEPLPLLLDAVAMSVGHRIVRLLDGTVRAVGPVTAKATQDEQLALDYPRVGGGLLALDIE